MCADRPTIHITNWSSKKLHGPGRKWTIMANPRKWEWGHGRIESLTPCRNYLLEIVSDELTWEAAKVDYRVNLDSGKLSPGKLSGWSHSKQLIADGDTICCGCSKESAAAGKCHRQWAAEALALAGWRVLLDRPDPALQPEETDQLPLF